MLGFVSAHAYWEGAFAAVRVLTCARVSVLRLFSATGYRRVGTVVQGLPCGPSLAVEPSDYHHLSDITLESQFHVELFMNTAAFLSSSLSSPCVPHCPLIKSGSWSYHQTKTMGTNKIATFWRFSDFSSQLTCCSWLSTWAILHSCPIPHLILRYCCLSPIPLYSHKLGVLSPIPHIHSLLILSYVLGYFPMYSMSLLSWYLSL